MNAWSTVMRVENEFAQKDSAEFKRRMAAESPHRQKLLETELMNQEAAVAAMCSEVVALRAALTTDNRGRTEEIKIMRQEIAALQGSAELGPDRISAAYIAETDRLVAEAGDGKRAAVRLASELQAAKALRDRLKAIAPR